MNLQQLRHLVATVEHGTMTRAAEVLHVSQPALTRSVRALERELGVPLFERAGRGVRPTDAGREAVRAARRALAEIDAITAVGAGLSCRVAATETQATELCASAMSRVIGGAGPTAVVLTTVDSATEVADLVASGRADLGVCDLPVPGALRATVLGHQETVLLCPSSWDLPDPFPARDLGTIALVVPSSGSRRRDQFDRGLAAFGVRAGVAFETDRLEHGVPLVLAGGAATFAYRRAARAAVAQGARAVALEPAVRRTVGYVRRPGRQPATVQRFIRALRAEAAATLDSRTTGALSDEPAASPAAP
jgi:LysR family cyn operon transcriptional activator